MTSSALPWTLCLFSIAILGCPGSDAGGGGTEGSSSGSGSDSTIPGASMTTQSNDDMMTTMGVDDTSTGGPPDPSTTMDPTTGPSDSTGAQESSTGPGDGSTGSGGAESSSGDPGPLQYPPCILGQDPVCEEPWEGCYDFIDGYNVCVQPCGEAADCPEPNTGDAVPFCAGFDGGQCVLDCQGDATCPDGMTCQNVFNMFFRCVWSNL